MVDPKAFLEKISSILKSKATHYGARIPTKLKSFRALLAWELGRLTWDFIVVRIVRLSVTYLVMEKIGETLALHTVENLINELEKVKQEGEDWPVKRAEIFMNVIRKWSYAIFYWPAVISVLDSDIAQMVSRGLESWYWSMGLGWLSWASMSPFINYYVANPLEDYLKKKFRPKDLPRDVFEKLYAFGVLKWDEFKEFLEKSGIPDEQIEKFRVYLLNELLGSKLKDFLHKGVVTEDYLREKLKEVVGDKFDIDKLLLTYYKEISESSIIKLLKAKLITEKEAIERLKLLGYSEKDAELILKVKNAEDSEEPRKLTASQVGRLYSKGYISREEAIDMLLQLGYDDKTAGLFLKLYEKEEDEKQKDITLSEIRRAFMLGIIGEKEASIMLKRLKLTDERISLLLEIWKKEKEPRYKKLSFTMIKKLFQNGILSDKEVYEKLQEIGYDPETAKKLTIYIIESSKGRPRRLSVSVLSKAIKLGLITEEELRKRLIALGYDPKDVDIYISVLRNTETERRRELTTTQILRAYKYNIIDDREVVERLAEKGYDIEDISILMALYSPKNIKE